MKVDALWKAGVGISVGQSQTWLSGADGAFARKKAVREVFWENEFPPGGVSHTRFGLQVKYDREGGHQVGHTCQRCLRHIPACDKRIDTITIPPVLQTDPSTCIHPGVLILPSWLPARSVDDAPRRSA